MSSRGPAVRTLAVGVLALCVAASGEAAQPPETPPPAAPTAATEEAKPAPKKRRRVYDDKRRTLKSYGANLKYNFAGAVTRGNHVPLLITAAFTAPAFAWDDEAISYFDRHPHQNFGDIGAALGGGLAVGGMTVGFFTAGRMVANDRFRATTYDLSQAMIVTQAYTQVLKVSVRRYRPDRSNRVSFPSGHASNAFTAASVIAHHYRNLRLPAYAVASYIAVSRMAANKHHFSDIVAGAGLGWGIGRAVYRRNGRPPDAPGHPDPPRVSLLPDHDLEGNGVGLRVHISF
jgi:membrane-associated phospholipid phosphatase